MNGADDDRTRLAWARATVLRYAHAAAWDVESDNLGPSSWEAVFVAGEGAAALRLEARRPVRAFATSFVFVLDLESAPYAARRPEVVALALERDFALREADGKGSRRRIEVSTRLWDAGLNRETFEAVTSEFLELGDIVRTRLARPKT